MQIKLAIAVVVAACTQADAASWAPMPSGQSGEWTVEGICTRLVVANENLLSDCTGEVTRSKTPDGIVTLRFATAKGKLSFRVRESTARLWQGYRSVLEIDDMAFGGKTIPAHGQCHYGAPYIGQATINCRGHDGHKSWVVTVKTAGQLPVPAGEYIAPEIKKTWPTPQQATGPAKAR